MIDNKSFIDEKNNVFTIINTLPLKKIQSNHKERLTEIRKSDKELQCVNPQIRDHSNKVLASKVFKLNEELYGFLGSREMNSSIVFHIGHERDPECHKIELFVVFHMVCINFISVNMVMPLHHTHKFKCSNAMKNIINQLQAVQLQKKGKKKKINDKAI